MENELRKALLPILDRLDDINAELDHFRQIEGFSVAERNRLKAMTLNLGQLRQKVIRALQVIDQQG